MLVRAASPPGAEGRVFGIVSTGYSSIAVDLNYDYRFRRMNEAIKKVMGSAPSPADIINGEVTIDNIEGPHQLRDLLLHGRDLRNARHMVQTYTSKDPTPTELQQKYIDHSLRSERNRTIAWIAISTRAHASGCFPRVMCWAVR